MGQLDYTTEKTNELLAKVEALPEHVAEGSGIVLETGTTTTLDPGQNATSEVVDNGVDDEGKHVYTINFGIPKGEAGAQGAKGEQGVAGKDGTNGTDGINGADGANGKTPVLETGDTTTLAAGSEATAAVVPNGTDTGGNPKYKLNFGIPKGADGSGSGNVYVNPAGLLAAKQYAFKPQADNSATGSFVEVEATGGGGAVDITDIVDPIFSNSQTSISEENYNKLKGYIESGAHMLYAPADSSYVYPFFGLLSEGIILNAFLSQFETGFQVASLLINPDYNVVNYSFEVPSLGYVGKGMMAGYSKPSAYSAISNSDSINRAIGKLEAGLNALQDKVANMEGNGGDDTTDDPLS